MKKLVAICLMVLGVLADANAEIALEPYVYFEDFETGELRAWASYPLWQDTAFDVNLRPNTMVPGDPNISIEQKVTPYSVVDNYVGVQKLLDMYLAPSSNISMKYYLKTTLRSEFFKVRFAAGEYGKIDYTVPSYSANGWNELSFSYEDLVSQNPVLQGKPYLRIYAIAVLVKFPDADPEEIIYLGIDDVKVDAMRKTHFQFSVPEMHKLSEWKPYIPSKHFRRGDRFVLEGSWPLNAGRVSLEIVNFTSRDKKLFASNLKRTAGNSWRTEFTLNLPDGLYLATLRAWSGKNEISDTEFTIFVAPADLGGKHPRILFDSNGLEEIKARLDSDKFKGTKDRIVSSARAARERAPLDSLRFISDTLIDESPRASGSTRFEFWAGSPNHGSGVISPNSDAFIFCGDNEAGQYARELILKLSEWPYWVHPWYLKRGRHIYYQPAVGGSAVAEAYDNLYHVMTEEERKTIREALMRNIIIPTHRGYVVDNLITEHSSNWIGMLFRGTMAAMIAIYGDDEEYGDLEPYFTGAIFKTWAHINTFDPDGGCGEPNNYIISAMNGIGYYGPGLYINFGIDMSAPVINVNNERIWAGNIRRKEKFYFGDSAIDIRSAARFVWFAHQSRDPLLNWFIDHVGGGNSFVFPLDDIPRKDPFDENPVRLFRQIGTTVFKSGWDEEDFIFVMRSGPFHNHQHLDQGSFWLADRGSIFFGERTGSSYYTDPLYQSRFIQPIGHSTILIDNNHQSQRVGDYINFAPGFDDYAFVRMFLDGENASYSSGELERLYWGKIESLRRNVLFLKPRTVLMLDTAVPNEGKDVDVTLLYQADLLRYITAGQNISSISREGNTLSVHHLYPASKQVEAVETPFYLNAKNREHPEGMLTLTARTEGAPLVIANLLNTDAPGTVRITESHPGSYMAGIAGGSPFAFSVNPGSIYTVNSITTDALALTWQNDSVFAADCTMISRGGKVLVRATVPLVCEITDGMVKYCMSEKGAVVIGTAKKPSSVLVNGVRTKFRYDRKTSSVSLVLDSGEGFVKIR